MFEIHVSLIALVVTMRYTFLEDKKGISFKKRANQLTVTSGIQLIWTGVFLFSTYGNDKLIFWLLVSMTSCLTALVMYKWVLKFGYWLLTNCLITAILTFVLIQYDKSPFQGFLGGMKEGFTPISTTIGTALLQMIIWSCIKFYKWESQGKVREKLPLKQSLIKGVKILSFQIALSLGLSIILVINNLIVSYSVIAFSLYLIFIIRKKISGNGIFWIISWIIIFDQTMTMVFQYFPEEARRYLEATQRKFEVWYFIIFIIYHILLTKFFKLKAERGESQNY
ncbi:hypothetical protein GYN14_01655 [Lactococcus piscium]|uniref:hypothetical protein n=1 Tax=Pseudolactococcus carnosus TaxID=2749961 RepID=UPI001FBB1D55|nr:hypothetical protein [Lactococcus carnosus]MCJ1991196.1 hypothetical protein [Lactococcus carnosus]